MTQSTKTTSFLCSFSYLSCWKQMCERSSSVSHSPEKWPEKRTTPQIYLWPVPKLRIWITNVKFNGKIWFIDSAIVKKLYSSIRLFIYSTTLPASANCFTWPDFSLLIWKPLCYPEKHHWGSLAGCQCNSVQQACVWEICARFVVPGKTLGENSDYWVTFHCWRRGTAEGGQSGAELGTCFASCVGEKLVLHCVGMCQWAVSSEPSRAWKMLNGAGGLFYYRALSQSAQRALSYVAGKEQFQDGPHHPWRRNRWEMLELDAHASRGTKGGIISIANLSELLLRIKEKNKWRGKDESGCI